MRRYLSASRKPLTVSCWLVPSNIVSLEHLHSSWRLLLNEERNLKLKEQRYEYKWKAYPFNYKLSNVDELELLSTFKFSIPIFRTPHLNTIIERWMVQRIMDRLQWTFTSWKTILALMLIRIVWPYANIIRRISI